jgi:Protein of unknown function (DUF1615)
MASSKIIGSGTPNIQSKIPRPMICIPLLLFIGVFDRLTAEETVRAFAVRDHSRLDSSNVRSFLRRAGRRCIPSSMLMLTVLSAGCASGPPAASPPAINPLLARAAMDASVSRTATDREGWVTDMYGAFTALSIQPTRENICAVAAVIAQESGFRVDPIIPNLPAVAWKEIDQRAERASVPPFIVHTALKLTSSTGRSYAERIDGARTEKDLSDIYEDFIGTVPMGRTLFAERDPIRTRGPMQVSVAFAEQYAADKPYPYPVRVSIADEVFTRRGSLYFGTAHLLDYSAPYDSYLYRFADFNAGQYASRNAAFQNAVSAASGIPLTPDGALLPHGGGDRDPGSTELAVRALSRRLNLDNAAIHGALELGKSGSFERTSLYVRVFALADRAEGRRMSRELVPHIQLHGPKISRNLTTAWYAGRVDQRFKRCLMQ